MTSRRNSSSSPPYAPGEFFSYTPSSPLHSPLTSPQHSPPSTPFQPSPTPQNPPKHRMKNTFLRSQLNLLRQNMANSQKIGHIFDFTSIWNNDGSFGGFSFFSIAAPATLKPKRFRMNEVSNSEENPGPSKTIRIVRKEPSEALQAARLRNVKIAQSKSPSFLKSQAKKAALDQQQKDKIAELADAKVSELLFQIFGDQTVNDNGASSNTSAPLLSTLHEKGAKIPSVDEKCEFLMNQLLAKQATDASKNDSHFIPSQQVGSRKRKFYSPKQTTEQ